MNKGIKKSKMILLFYNSGDFYKNSLQKVMKIFYDKCRFCFWHCYEKFSDRFSNMDLIQKEFFIILIYYSTFNWFFLKRKIYKR